jgi:hypothetical protein
MSRISFTDELPASSRSGEQFAKLKLKEGEKARIVLLETPEVVFQHQLYEPILENGRGVRKTLKSKDGKSTYEVWDEKFIKSFQCLGDEDTVSQNGVDVKNCPACLASTQYDRFKAPGPRYALNIVRYNTKNNTSEPTSPFGISVVVWIFGEQKFKQLRSYAKEGGYDLKKHDVILGPCQHEGFQKYEMLVAQEAVWLQSESNKKATMEAFQANRIEDLSPLIAQTLDRDVVQGYVDRVKRAWDVINGVVMNNTEAIIASADLPKAAASLADLGVSNDVDAPLPTGSVNETEDFDSLLKTLEL